MPPPSEHPQPPPLDDPELQAFARRFVNREMQRILDECQDALLHGKTLELPDNAAADEQG
jgi:hypothetical protein